MIYGDKVFVVTPVNVVKATIRQHISRQGVVTGYEVTYVPSENSPTPMLTKVLRKNVFTDEDAAMKALFINTLKKKEEETNQPSEDKKSDRRWIPGFKKRKW